MPKLGTTAEVGLNSDEAHILKSILTILTAVLLMAAIIRAQDRSSLPDRDHFLREVLEPAATDVTPKFDDYTKGSYHVDKLDLLQGLGTAATNAANRLRAVVILGPESPMWTYYILAFQDRPDGVQVNKLVFAHARIVSKQTKTIKEPEFQKLLTRFSAPGLLTKGDPSSLETSEERPQEHAYNLLAAVWASTARTTYFREIEKNSLDPGLAERTKKSDDFSAALDGLMLNATTTYPVRK